jgi:hypothetical protein
MIFREKLSDCQVGDVLYRRDQVYRSHVIVSVDDKHFKLSNNTLVDRETGRALGSYNTIFYVPLNESVQFNLDKSEVVDEFERIQEEVDVNSIIRNQKDLDTIKSFIRKIEKMYSTSTRNENK